MKKTVVFFIVLLILKGNIAFAKAESEFQYKLNQVPITDEMKSFVIKTCENEIYTLYQGTDLPNTKGMNFKETKLTSESAEKISDAVIISKLSIYKAIRLNESNFYGIYVKNQGMYFYKDDIIKLLKSGYLSESNGSSKQIKSDNKYEDIFVVMAEKTDECFRYINTTFWKDPELGWDNFLMFDEVPNTELDNLGIMEYKEYFRKMMVNSINGNLDDERVLFIETTYAR